MYEPFVGHGWVKRLRDARFAPPINVDVSFSIAVGWRAPAPAPGPAYARYLCLGCYWRRHTWRRHAGGGASERSVAACCPSAAAPRSAARRGGGAALTLADRRRRLGLRHLNRALRVLARGKKQRLAPRRRCRKRTRSPQSCPRPRGQALPPRGPVMWVEACARRLRAVHGSPPAKICVLQLLVHSVDFRPSESS